MSCYNVDDAIFGTNTKNTASKTAVKDPVADFKKGIKRDPALFPFLYKDSGWKIFHRDLFIQAKSQDVVEILDHTYVPWNISDKNLFDLKQAYMYGMFTDHLKTVQDKKFIDKYKKDTDAQKLLAGLTDYYNKSTAATDEASDILQFISNVKAHEYPHDMKTFLVEFSAKLSRYNDIVTPELTEDQQRVYLEQAVEGVASFANVKNTSQLLAVTSGTTLSYDKYLGLLQTAAEQHDSALLKSKTRRRGQRLTYAHEFYPPSSNYDDDDAIPYSGFDVHSHEWQAANWEPYSIYQQQQHPQARLPRSTWYGLSSDAQQTWDTLAPADKATIIEGIRASQPPSGAAPPAPPAARPPPLPPPRCPPRTSAPPPNRSTRSVRFHDFHDFNPADYREFQAYQAFHQGRASDDQMTEIPETAHQDDAGDQADTGYDQPYTHLTNQQTPETNHQIPQALPRPGNVNRLLSPSLARPGR